MYGNLFHFWTQIVTMIMTRYFLTVNSPTRSGRGWPVIIIRVGPNHPLSGWSLLMPLLRPPTQASNLRPTTDSMHACMIPTSHLFSFNFFYMNRQPSFFVFFFWKRSEHDFMYGLCPNEREQKGYYIFGTLNLKVSVPKLLEWVRQ